MKNKLIFFCLLCVMIFSARADCESYTMLWDSKLSLKGEAYSIASCQAEIDEKSKIEEANALLQQALRITNDQKFDLDTCLKAMPLLNQALNKLRPHSDLNNSFARASLQLGRCLMVQEKYHDAAVAFKDVVNLAITNHNTTTDEARILLADLYNQGLGVEQDKLKALGLYMMCDIDEFDRKRKAAELIISLNGLPTRLAYKLLEDDAYNPPKDMMRAYKLHSAKNMSEPFQGFIENAISSARIYEFNERAKIEKGTQRGIENEVAVKEIYAVFGNDALDKGHFDEALAYLNKANPDEVKNSLKKLQQNMPHQLIQHDEKPPSMLFFGNEKKLKNRNIKATLSGINTALLATQLEKRLAKGELYPIHNTRNQWILETYIADRTIYDSNNVAHYYLIAIETSKAKPEEAEFVKPTIKVIASVAAIDLSQALRNKMPSQFLPQDKQLIKNNCIDPDDNNIPIKINNYDEDEDEDEDENYPTIGPNWQLKKLSPSHNVLMVNRSRFEGYAGGGAGATAEMLLDIRSGQLIPIACYGVSSSVSIAGDWHKDGTRKHYDSYTNWSVKIQGKNSWPNIRLISNQKNKPSLKLQWSEQEQYYLLQNKSGLADHLRSRRIHRALVKHESAK